VKNWWREAWPVLAALGAIGTIAGVPIGCVMHDESKRDASNFAAEQKCGLYAGDIVRAVIDGRKGMVTGIHAGYVWVRFAQPREETNTRIFGSDGPIDLAPYAEVKMACFEVNRSE
jgi:hypothetical protein